MVSIGKTRGDPRVSHEILEFNVFFVLASCEFVDRIVFQQPVRWLKDQPAATSLAHEQSPVMQQASLKA
jgi:hypothetical protein